ncbi:ribonuclease HepT family protein [Arthrobacter rhombi]
MSRGIHEYFRVDAAVITDIVDTQLALLAATIREHQGRADG